MRIALSGNVYMLPDILEAQEALEDAGHEIVLAFEHVEQLFEESEEKKETSRKSFFEKMKNCDALLVMNKLQKKGKTNYISGSSFLEMGFAHALGKKIFIMQNVPEVSYRDEILAMKPIVLNGKLDFVK